MIALLILASLNAEIKRATIIESELGMRRSITRKRGKFLDFYFPQITDVYEFRLYARIVKSENQASNSTVARCLLSDSNKQNQNQK